MRVRIVNFLILFHGYGTKHEEAFLKKKDGNKKKLNKNMCIFNVFKMYSVILPFFVKLTLHIFWFVSFPSGSSFIPAISNKLEKTLNFKWINNK